MNVMLIRFRFAALSRSGIENSTGPKISACRVLYRDTASTRDPSTLNVSVGAHHGGFTTPRPMPSRIDDVMKSPISCECHWSFAKRENIARPSGAISGVRPYSAMRSRTEWYPLWRKQVPISCAMQSSVITSPVALSRFCSHGCAPSFVRYSV